MVMVGDKINIPFLAGKDWFFQTQPPPGGPSSIKRPSLRNLISPRTFPCFAEDVGGLNAREAVREVELP
jgi:hypothetical protein